MPFVTYLDHILGPIGKFEGVRTVHDSNFIDRLSHHYTIIYLLFFTTFVVTVEYVMEPITCWCPPQFTDKEVFYTNYVCWVSNTYYIPLHKDIPAEYEMRDTHEITYYQYTPLIFLMMALVFYLPRLTWRYLISRSGLPLKKMLNIIYEAQNFQDPVDRHRNLRNLAEYIDQFCSNMTRYRSGICHNLREYLSAYLFFGCGRHFRNYLVTLSLFTKLMYVLVAVVQLFFLNEFLGNEFYLFGYEVFFAYFSGKRHHMSPRFPRITLCDFNMRQLNNVHRWTLQCVLPINYYNEIFFVFCWLWITVLAVLSFLNLIYSLVSVFYPKNARTFAKKYLLLGNNDSGIKRSAYPKLVDKFMNQFLGPDGLFILKLISKQNNTFLLPDLVHYLWKYYLRRMRHADPSLINSALMDRGKNLEEVPLLVDETEELDMSPGGSGQRSKSSTGGSRKKKGR